MPSLEDIIGLSGIELKNVVTDEFIEVGAVVTFRPFCPRCNHHRCRIKNTFIRKLKHSRQGNRLIVLHERSHKYFCPNCGRHFNHQIAGVLPSKRSTESFRMEVYEKHHGGMSQSLLSKLCGIGHATVERWYQPKSAA